MRTSEGDESDAVFRFGEFTFDCRSQLLLYRQSERHVSPKARQLLRLLLLNRSRAMSRKELYDELWPATFVCETNLTSLVSELRRALDDGKSTQYVRTIHGFGYVFAADASATRPELIPEALLLCEHQYRPLYYGENSIGRAYDCRIILNGATVSRHHALITIAREEIFLIDLQSKNGTYVNGRKVVRAIVHYEEPILFGAVEATILPELSATVTLVLPPRRVSDGNYGTPR